MWNSGCQHDGVTPSSQVIVGFGYSTDCYYGGGSCMNAFTRSMGVNFSTSVWTEIASNTFSSGPVTVRVFSTTTSSSDKHFLIGGYDPTMTSTASDCYVSHIAIRSLLTE
jgi:hypothetical protein